MRRSRGAHGIGLVETGVDAGAGRMLWRETWCSVYSSKLLFETQRHRRRDALKTLALGFLRSRLGVTSAPSVFSNLIGVLDSHLVSVAGLPLPMLAFGFPGSPLNNVDSKQQSTIYALPQRAKTSSSAWQHHENVCRTLLAGLPFKCSYADVFCTATGMAVYEYKVQHLWN